MKKFTIIATPENEHLILRDLGRARIAQLKYVTGGEFEKLRTIGERDIEFKGLYNKFHEKFLSLEKAGLLELEVKDLPPEKLREFIENPDQAVGDFLNVLDEILTKSETVGASYEEKKTNLIETRARLESLRGLQPEEFKKCLTVGMVDPQNLERLNSYLKRFEDISLKTIEISPELAYIYVFGEEKRREWVEALFLLFEVRDIYEALNSIDILLVLDAEKRKEAIKEYVVEVEKLQAQIDAEDPFTAIRELYAPVLGEAIFFEQMLRILSDKSTPVLRTKVISVIQGWIQNKKQEALDQIVNDLQEKTGDLVMVRYEDPTHDEHNVPTADPEMKPSLLQPAYKLTTLRGWPSVHEINPSYILILIFSFQFGLMFGDIGQGAIFLITGIYLSRTYKKGMASKLGSLFIPMGIAAITFGFLYDSIFLMEGLLFHHNQIMPNPVHDTTRLMLLVFKIAAIEVIIGLVLGAINQIKSGNPIGALGEHGLGMILYVAGLYLTATYFIKIGMNFNAALGHWTFYLAMAGILLSFLEPIIHSVAHGHGVGMEVIGEGIGGLLMTFVEGLANLFSFLRIAAFALAHASLAIAAVSLSDSLGIAGIGLIIMNVIAMSFEFVSSTVQSLRLLYYEFMGKFFQGGGMQFKPFRIKRKK